MELGLYDRVARVNAFAALISIAVHIVLLIRFGSGYQASWILWQFPLWSGLCVLGGIWILLKHRFGAGEWGHDEREALLVGHASAWTYMCTLCTSMAMVVVTLYAATRPERLSPDMVFWAAWLMLHILIASLGIGRIFAGRRVQ